MAMLQCAHRPENVPCLIPTIINPDVFRHFPKKVKDSDTMLCYIENVIYKAGDPAVQTWAALVEAEAGLLEMMTGEEFDVNKDPE